MKLIEEIQKLIHQKSIEEIIVGFPYNIDGSISKHAKRVQIFVQLLAKHIQLPIILHDERLTTSEARISFIEYNIEGDTDTEAARLILESYEKIWSEKNASQTFAL
jgi:putative transcription antitermination factor YqgF